jgi:phytoene synthase
MRLRNGSRSFYAASLLLPQDMAACATALYAFCRDVDDAVDEEGRAEDAVEQLELRLQRVYAGRPEDRPEDRAFSQVVERFAIPRAIPEALLEGMRWDMSERHYEDEAALYAYCARVAATVGSEERASRRRAARAARNTRSPLRQFGTMALAETESWPRRRTSSPISA